MQRLAPWLLAVFLACSVLASSTVVVAQNASNDVFNLFAPKAKPTQTEISTRFEPATAKTGDVISLLVEVNLPNGSHTYSLSPSFSGRTKLNVATLEGLEATEKDFSVNQKPTVKDDKLLGQTVETHHGKVVWSRKYRVTNAATAQAKGVVNLQVCDADSCRPIVQKFDLSFRTFETKHSLLAKSGDPQSSVADWTAKLSPQDAKKGEVVTLEVSAKLAAEYHTFALDQDPKNYGLPTVITVAALNGLKPVDAKANFTPDRKPDAHEELGKAQRIYHDRVTFSRKFEVTEEKFGLSGKVSYQVCKGSCRQGRFDFALGDIAASKDDGQKAAVTPDNQPGGNGQGGERETALAQFLDGMKFREAGGDTASTSLWMNLLYAFIGGLILNVMPCVLPVIAIKALSFAQQAGEQRSQILLLNVAYSAGVVVVFLLLATFAAFAGLTWGGLFQKVEFNIGMCVLVFSMGLSLLGVFEIPIPGFVGSAAGSQHREGPSGAFLTGVFATILATPCSGPFLGATLAWSVKQPLYVIYLIWGTMGLGMASPYLLFAVSPRAVRLLPRPGNWMVTFKQLAGFVLLGTAIYLLSLVEGAYQMPTLVTLLGAGVGLWMIGTLYDFSSSPQRRWTVRVCAAVATAAISWFGFSLQSGRDKYPWQPFDPQGVMAELKAGKPVMIDFTASWCLTCKVVEKATLNTNETAALVEKHGIVPFKADWSDGSDEIRTVLDKLGSNSIPVLAVFSPDRPKEPTILRDAWSQSALSAELEKAAEKATEKPADSAAQVASSKK